MMALTRPGARSQVYGFLALGFGDPDRVPIALLKREGKRLADSLEMLGETKRLAVARALRPLLAAMTQRGFQAAHVACFGHTISKECPPYDTEYGAAHIFQKTQMLADIAGFYRAFGLETAPDLHERVDHVSVELEFMRFLCLKEFYALEQGHSAERLAQCREAQAKFLGEHVGRWAPGFARRLRELAGEGYYARMGELTDAFLTGELAALGIENTDGAALRSSIPSEEAPDTCGACEVVRR